jgi:hypothetical protein
MKLQVILVHHSLLDTLYLKYGADTVESEIRKSRDSLNKHLNGQKALTFAYPEGDGGDNSPTSDQVRKILHKYYIGARAAGVCPAGYDTYPYSKSTAFNDFYYQIESFPNFDTTSLNDYTHKLDEAIQNGGWFLPMYHTFNQNDYLSVTTAAFTDQMNAINNRKNSLWIAPFQDVIKYHKEKNSATVGIITSTGQIAISLADTITNPEFDMPLTLLVSNLASDCQIDSIKQGTYELQFQAAGNTVQFNAFPDHGNITIYKSTIVYAVPVLTTSGASSVTESSASITGNVTNDGNATVTSKGVCWSTLPHPTISDNKSMDGTGEGSFTSSIGGLSGNTTYYARAYGTNNVGTAYGNEVSFTTALPTGIGNNSVNNNISIYPNPAQDLFYLSIRSFTIPLLEFKIINSVGVAVYKEDLNQFTGDYFKEIDLNGLADGIYCLEVITGKNRIIGKIIIQ